MTGPPEEPLNGGNVTGGIVRVGDTVRRSTGYWTPAVHALLRHVEAAGFAGAPRVLGIDERRREILSFAPGRAAWPWDAFAPLATDEGLIRAARLIVDLHAAAASFTPPPNARWSDVAPRNGAQMICHNDLAPWNLIIGPSGQWTFIDWDLAAPGTRLSDLAYAARNFAPLFPDRQLDLPIVHRLRLLCEVWEVVPVVLLPAIVWRARADVDAFRARAEAGQAPWAEMWRSGHGESNEAIARFVEDNVSAWLVEMG